ncbi:hypothetical protein L3V82_10655 [Thiotrichales bacterium 19S3-7]|nr:hypothetical protein [Thiotrichales bacterium 19S3-7]MCF6802617.1 hypothetical protein [Thiotrichales bacterium 19S3-11]
MELILSTNSSYIFANSIEDQNQTIDMVNIFSISYQCIFIKSDKLKLLEKCNIKKRDHTNNQMKLFFNKMIKTSNLSTFSELSDSVDSWLFINGQGHTNAWVI